MSERKPVTRVTKHRSSKIAISVVGHLLATSTFFVVFASFFFTEHSLGLLKVGINDAALRPDIVGPALLIFGLSGCAWALLFIIYRLAKTHVQRPKHVALKKARGTIIAETLIVLPVFFMLTFGLAQMALTSIAGLLTTLASYEITRGLAVWSVEEGNSRSPGGNVSASHIRDKMRLQAAAVIAPATPEISQTVHCNLGPAQQMITGMAGAGFVPAATGQGTVFSMAEAYGHRTFAERGPSKLASAYCAIDVQWTDVTTDPTYVERDTFTSTLRYTHPAAMPVVAWVFASDPNSPPWSTPYTSIIERKYTMTTYLTPNDRLP